MNSPLSWQHQFYRERLARRLAENKCVSLKTDFDRQIHSMQEEATAAVNTKNQFFANVSHELRTPLTAIIGFANALASGQWPLDQAIDILGIISRNSNHLLNIINDILDVTKIELHPKSLEHIQITLPQVLQDIAENANMQTQAKHLQFDFEVTFPLPQTITTDLTRFRQILINLVNNAVKFTETGKISMQVAFQQTARMLLINIKDTGIGMSETQIQKIFNPFAQADASTTRRFGGTGLGLYLCKQISQLLGGEITVKSQVNQGSCFTLRLPIVDFNPDNLLTTRGQFDQCAIANSETTAHQATKIPLLSGHVLLAEDGPDNQKLVGFYLKNAGIEFKIVDNGEEAVTAALTDAYDLILMDMQMPKLDGKGAFELMRQTGCLTPVIAFTGNVFPEDIEDYQRLGFAGHIAKPIDVENFYSTLAHHLPEAYSAAVFNGKGSEKEHNMHSQSFQSLKNQFLKHLSIMQLAIENAFKQQDWQQYQSELHILKGIAGSYGFQEITDYAALLEAQCKRFEAAATKDELQHLIALIETALTGNIT